MVVRKWLLGVLGGGSVVFVRWWLAVDLLEISGGGGCVETSSPHHCPLPLFWLCSCVFSLIWVCGSILRLRGVVVMRGGGDAWCCGRGGSFFLVTDDRFYRIGVMFPLQTVVAARVLWLVFVFLLICFYVAVCFVVRRFGGIVLVVVVVLSGGGGGSFFEVVVAATMMCGLWVFVGLSWCGFDGWLWIRCQNALRTGAFSGGG